MRYEYVRHATVQRLFQRLSTTGFNAAIFVETIALTKPFTIPTLNLTFLHHA